VNTMSWRRSRPNAATNPAGIVAAKVARMGVAVHSVAADVAAVVAVAAVVVAAVVAATTEPSAARGLGLRNQTQHIFRCAAFFC